MVFFMKKIIKRIVSLILILCFLLSVVSFAKTESFFDDVTSSSYCYDAVLWAVENGVTTGVSEKLFAPEETCTRGQIVTFLYRAAGEPAVANDINPFVDVNADDYFYNPVMWAVKQGITTGVDDTHFDPEASCTRAQAVTFLWRAAGWEEDYIDPNPFTDLSQGAYYVNPVLWAVKKTITNGVDATHFGPDETCQRGQIVTFLYRLMKNDSNALETRCTRADIEQAIVDSFWSYYVKGAKLQYDDAQMNVVNYVDGGNIRAIQDIFPEDITSDSTGFTVCDEFVRTVYMNAITGGEIYSSTKCGWVGQDMWLAAENVAGTGKDICLVRWRDSSKFTNLWGLEEYCGVTEKHMITREELKTYLRNAQNNLRPGDILTMGYDNLSDSHTVLYIGNGKFVHSTIYGGGRYDYINGKDVIESEGTVHAYASGADYAAYLSFNATPNSMNEFAWIMVTRPINMLVQDNGNDDPSDDVAIKGVNVKESTISREKYPCMDIDKTVSIKPYGSAQNGEEITYTVEITNLSSDNVYLTQFKGQARAYKDLSVEEYIPEGCELVKGSITSGGVLDGNKISWNVNVPFGNSVKCSFKVKVNLKSGDTLVSKSGLVDGTISTPSLTNYVGKAKFTETDAANGFNCINNNLSTWLTDYSINASDGIEFAEQIYKNIFGKTIDLDSSSKILEDSYDYKVLELPRDDGTQAPQHKTSGTTTTRLYTSDMTNPLAVDRFYGGKSTHFFDDHDHYLELKSKDLTFGDILVYYTLEPYDKNDALKERAVINVVVGVYLGQDTFAVYDNGNITIENNAFIEKCLTYDVFLNLRPSNIQDMAN